MDESDAAARWRRLTVQAACHDTCGKVTVADDAIDQRGVRSVSQHGILSQLEMTDS